MERFQGVKVCHANDQYVVYAPESVLKELRGALEKGTFKEGYERINCYRDPFYLLSDLGFELKGVHRNYEDSEPIFLYADCDTCFYYQRKVQ